MSASGGDVSEPRLPYRILDADNHFNEPPYVFERYIDPKHRDKVIRFVVDENGKQVQLFAGRPSKFSSEQVTFSADELEKIVGTEIHSTGAPDALTHDFSTIPGVLLNRLNPYTGLDDEEREKLVAQFREKSAAFGDRDLRLALMDDQGIEAALMFPARAHDIEFEFADDVDAIYANTRAFNRWIHEEVGYAYQNRMFLPPYIPLADVDLAVAELETVIGQGAPIVQFRAGHAHGGRGNPQGGRSLADPLFDPIWSRIDEADVRVAIHLGATDYQKLGALDWSESPDDTFGNFDAFQWVMYWGDRPAMETVAGMVLHNLFGRFPKVRVCLSGQGTGGLPYILRKMDHAYFMGRKAKWGALDRRPSAIFKEHFVVAPFPEENVKRVVDEVGVAPIVFGSDFPHGEGLAFPDRYASQQLRGLPDDVVKTIMRDNLADYLGLPA